MKVFKFFRGTDSELEDLIRELDAIQQRVQEINREGEPVADRVVIDIVDEASEILRQNLNNALFSDNEEI